MAYSTVPEIPSIYIYIYIYTYMPPISVSLFLASGGGGSVYEDSSAVLHGLFEGVTSGWE